MPLAAANARQRNVLIAGGALLLAGAIGVLDYVLGPEILLGLFYLVPISAAAWFGGKRSGLLVSGLSALAWTVANVIPARHSHPAIAAWNAAWGLGFFLVVSLLVSKLRALNEIHADNGGAAQADAANAPCLASQPGASALPSRPPHRLRVLGRGKWLAAGHRLPGIRFSASDDTARPPRSLMAVFFEAQASSSAWSGRSCWPLSRSSWA